MKILIHDYAGHPFPVGLSRELARRGHRVLHAYASSLLTPRGTLVRQEDDPEGLGFAQVKMNENYRRDKYSFLKRRRYEVAYGREAQKLIRGWEPELVLSGNTPSEPQWLAIREANRMGVPFVYWVQDFYSIAVKNLAGKRSRILGWLAGRYYEQVDRKCYRNSAHTVAITSDFRPILAKYGVEPDRITVIENWGALAEMPMIGKENDWSREQGLNRFQVLMYTGTLAMKHNPNLLLNLARAFSAHESSKIVVVSEGPGADHLKRAVQEEKLSNLLVLPFQPFSRMPEVLGSADVFLALLEPDAGVFSVPSKVLTYLCAGKPTLAAVPRENLAGRLLLSNEAGIVVDPADERAFAENAAMLMANPRQRHGLGDNARRFAEARFDIATIADAFLGVFERAKNCRNNSSDVARQAVHLTRA